MNQSIHINNKKPLHVIVLLNMGGPSSIDEVEKYLFGIFSDKYMINLIHPFRYLLAKYISKKRKPYAEAIYKKIGGKSPIFEETTKQAEALQQIIGDEYKVLFSMRYSSPYADDVVRDILDIDPQTIILLPLYPQYCRCTTLSSIQSIKNALPKHLLQRTKIICCYYDDESFVEAHCDEIMKYFNIAKKYGKPRILFSAHGIPQHIVDKGDPYEFQINCTVNSIIKKLNISEAEYNWNLCYQSKIGRLKWLGPSTEDVIKKFATEVIIVVPIAFTSEHSETLVELDIEYQMLSKNKYFRVPALSANNKFIRCLKELCIKASKERKCTKKCYKNCC